MYEKKSWSVVSDSVVSEAWSLDASHHVTLRMSYVVQYTCARLAFLSGQDMELEFPNAHNRWRSKRGFCHHMDDFYVDFDGVVVKSSNPFLKKFFLILGKRLQPKSHQPLHLCWVTNISSYHVPYCKAVIEFQGASHLHSTFGSTYRARQE